MREAMSHARTKMLTTAVSSLTSGWRHFRTYTANAATVSERHAFANLSAWRIAAWQKQSHALILFLRIQERCHPDQAGPGIERQGRRDLFAVEDLGAAAEFLYNHFCHLL